MYNIANLKSYGKKPLISRLLAILGTLNRKGYVCLNMSKELSKELRRDGLRVQVKMNSKKIIVEAILEKEKHGQLCPDTIKNLKDIIDE